MHLSPRTLARAVGVSESSLKRWADEGRLVVERTAGGHRRIPVSEAVRFIRRWGLTPVRPELLGLPADDRSGTAVAGASRSASESLTALLRQDRSSEAQSLIVSLYLDGKSLAWICDDVIRVALEEIGHLWQHDADGVFVEHRATETCRQALTQLRLLLGQNREGPVALGGGAAGDVYQIANSMVALILAEAGFQERNLGPDTPDSAILAAVQNLRPRLVWRSFSVPPRSIREATRSLARLAEALSDGVLVVGGRSAASIHLPSAPNVFHLGSMTELLSFARGLGSAVADSSDQPAEKHL
jgi:MerR family transcriptional regulator, light-induced transcriptional regulator